MWDNRGAQNQTHFYRKSIADVRAAYSCIFISYGLYVLELFYCQYSVSFKISKKCYKSARAAREKETLTAVIDHSGWAHIQCIWREALNIKKIKLTSAAMALCNWTGRRTSLL